jgi:hypothetical protein|nr:MAG TPA: hypothetical protein [Inoviridae sp.]
MSKQLKKLATKAVALGTLTMASASSFAAGYADIGANIDFTDGKTAVTAVVIGIAGFLIFGMVGRYILSFFKRV